MTKSVVDKQIGDKISVGDKNKTSLKENKKISHMSIHWQQKISIP